MKYFFWFFVFSAGFAFSQTITPVSKKLLQFAKDNFGKKVDRGECWDLANAALTYANADWSAPFNFGEKINYKTEGFAPGEIIQFTNTKFLYPNQSFTFTQHTAIVLKAKGNAVTVYHQNFNNKRKVDTLTIDFSYMKSGSLDVYRPKSK